MVEKERDGWEEVCKQKGEDVKKLQTSLVVEKDKASDCHRRFELVFTAMTNQKYGDCDCRNVFPPLVKKIRNEPKKIWEKPDPTTKVSDLQKRLKEATDNLKKVQDEKDAQRKAIDDLSDQVEKLTAGESEQM
jgi:polyhydroxyalkanoate synthesis regulator phasin